jgi:hypothetical protein
LKIEISKRARLELERAAKWWDTPNILWDELEEAGRRLLENPEAGRRWISSKGRIMWRLLLPRSQRHIYYAYFPNRQLIVVRCVWGAQRGREPNP